MKPSLEILSLYINTPCQYKTIDDDKLQNGSITFKRLDDYPNYCIQIIPFLRSIDSLTQEECEILGWDWHIIYLKACAPIKNRYTPAEFKLLLSWSIDLFGLISQSLAIDIQTQEKAVKKEILPPSAPNKES